MPKLFDDNGNLVNELAISRTTQIISTLKHQFACLADSGATSEELKAYAFTLSDKIASVVEIVLQDRETAIAAQENEDEEKAKND